MKIRFGYELIYTCYQATPMTLMLHSQPNGTQRLLIHDEMRVQPMVPMTFYTDAFGNTCTRLEMPPGELRLTADGLLEDSGVPEPAFEAAAECPIMSLPDSAFQYLLPSRYCESDLLAPEALRLFGHLPPGWSRAQAICDFVNRHVTFGYPYARSTRTALETYREGQGVCRDLAHLAIAFCRAMNIPARYCTTYLGDIGVPPVDAPMDFAGCIELYLGGGWHTFDPRNNARRIGRLLIARGRDAADVAISTAFGYTGLKLFRVWTEEVSELQADYLINNARSGNVQAA